MTTSIRTDDLKRRMHGAVEALRHDLRGLRTGRASTALLDPIQVEVYGTNMPLNQVATVSVPEARMLGGQGGGVVVGGGGGSCKRPAGREGDPHRGPGYHPDPRGADDPPADTRTD